MSANFLSLPSELRNNIYEQLLVLQELLLRANKTVHLEASSMLYAQNRFDFTMCTSEDVTSFLEQIGRNNASYILYICVDFPQFHYLDSDYTELGALTTSLHSTNAMEVKLDALDHPKIVAEALALVDARFRAFSSLQEIIVEVYEDGPSNHIRREMKNHGWTISATEYVEEPDFDRSFSEIEEAGPRPRTF
ncbi:hypothetical protein V2W45_1496829 [Cenococcum geophilum]